jgi:hypothetical protein
LDKLINKFDPEGRDPRLEARLVKSWESDETKELTPAIKMFTRMDAAEQKKLLNKMTPQERDEYLPHAKKILRYNYEAPQ